MTAELASDAEGHLRAELPHVAEPELRRRERRRDVDGHAVGRVGRRQDERPALDAVDGPAPACRHSPHGRTAAAPNKLADGDLHVPWPVWAGPGSARDADPDGGAPREAVVRRGRPDPAVAVDPGGAAR